MLEQVLSYLNNWFITEIQSGEYTIEDKKIELSFLQDGQYFRIMGSVFNDGLYLYDENLELVKDETFDGTIWALAIPNMVIDIAKQIQDWQDKYGDVVAGPYSSESFGGYSYSKGTGYSSSEEVTWQSKFAAMLAPYRKLRETGAVTGGMGYQDPSYRRPFNPDFPWG